MKQLLYRLPPSLVKDYLVKFNSRQMGREEVCQALGISKTRLYEIRTEWLRDSERFTLEAAGGDHACAWPPECAATALSLIGAAGDDGVNFALISDELARRHGFAKTRTAVMRYCKRGWDGGGKLRISRISRMGWGREATDFAGGEKKVATELLYKELTEQIIGAAFEVYRLLGYGFLEKVYQRALEPEKRRKRDDSR